MQEGGEGSQQRHPDQSPSRRSVGANDDFDTEAIDKEQGERTGRSQGFIFPYDGRSVGAAFRRVCRDLAIENLHFHDLRQEAISRLFKADWDIQNVAMVSIRTLEDAATLYAPAPDIRRQPRWRAALRQRQLITAPFVKALEDLYRCPSESCQ